MWMLVHFVRGTSLAYVPVCHHDLFISYASESNREGWVEQFANVLGQELADLLGRQFVPKDSVFLDKRELEVAQSFPVRLTAAARASAILVPVLSPGYLASEWCDRERTAFFSELPYGAEPADCLAPILIRPIDKGGLNKLYRDAERLSFLGADGQTPLAVSSTEWMTRLRVLAGQLRNALQNLRRKCRPVFLGKAAETERSRDLRAWCRSELERRCFRTVPEVLQALEDPDAVRASVQEAGLAVHFLGGADPSALEAIETSVDVCTGPTILYQPFGAALSLDEQIWLPAFEGGLAVPPGHYQRLTGKNDQELLALVDEQITRFREDSGAAQAKVELGLVCDEADLNGVRQLKDDIASRSLLALEFPDFLGAPLKAMERLRKWQDYLSRSEALLFYDGAAQRNRLELIWQKAELSRPGAKRSWFLAPPDLDNKLLKQPDPLSTADQVIRFVERLRSAHA
jgi:hypothetical protein